MNYRGTEDTEKAPRRVKTPRVDWWFGSWVLLCASVVQKTSATALPVSTILSGRPTFDWFSNLGSTPSALQNVQNRSGTVTGRSATSTPSLSVAPTTRPPRTPAPARATLNACG